MHILFFLKGATLAIYAAVMPGPFQAYLLSQSLKNGWRESLPLALTPILTDGPIIILVLFILTRIPQIILETLSVLGGLFILYLARAILLSLKQPFPVIGPSASTKAKGFGNAVILNILNPNPYIFWGVVSGPIFLAAWRQAPYLGVSFLIGFYGILILSLAALIVLFATIGGINTGVNRVVNIIACCALILFGAYQCLAGLITLGSRISFN
ncbi:putative Lysine exporter protein (LYSE/YGGA) [uncultured Desulfobacterium sp.]|uniref:Putative Lysine exporter protein (LYSE/YGGA) n=1 Tax=uncultured Desulfobacterium sp. TaxID=201089 RepID=A0A445MWH3_9BACT|nr:putative Lysine exporter protein (LYSE/YGGA) [uncultured Desulfobacterium sp.]